MVKTTSGLNFLRYAEVFGYVNFALRPLCFHKTEIYVIFDANNDFIRSRLSFLQTRNLTNMSI